MMMQHAREISPSINWDILRRIKCSNGLAVNELAGELKMSYMGVKQHCDTLKKRGYLDTWRKPKGTGRPEKIYRSTAKADQVLTHWGNELSLGLLVMISQSYGENAPDRFLFTFLKQKAEKWGQRVKGDTLLVRGQELAKARTADGWLSEWREDENGQRLVEHHSPLIEVARMFPNIEELETRVLNSLLGCEMERRNVDGRIEFWINGEGPTA